MRVSIKAINSNLPEVICEDESLEQMAKNLNKQPQPKWIVLDGQNGKKLINLSNVVYFERRR